MAGGIKEKPSRFHPSVQAAGGAPGAALRAPTTAGALQRSAGSLQRGATTEACRSWSGPQRLLLDVLFSAQIYSKKKILKIKTLLLPCRCCAAQESCSQDRDDPEIQTVSWTHLCDSLLCSLRCLTHNESQVSHCHVCVRFDLFFCHPIRRENLNVRRSAPQDLRDSPRGAAAPGRPAKESPVRVVPPERSTLQQGGRHRASRRYAHRSKGQRRTSFTTLLSVLSENHQPSPKQKNSLELNRHKHNHWDLFYNNIKLFFKISY